MFNVKAVVLGCDGVNGLTVIRSLGRHGVPVVGVGYHRESLGFYSRYTMDKYVFPDPVINENRFLSLLLSHAKKWDGALLFPISDAALEAVSKYRDELSEHYIVPVPAWRHVKKMVDKKGVYDLASSLGIKIPKTFYVESQESLDKALEKLEFPVLLKPRKSVNFWTKFSFKLKVMNTPEELRHFMGSLESDYKMMVQEFIPGQENQLHYYFGYYDSEGTPVVEFTGEKLRQNPPWFGVGRIMKSTHSNKIISLSRKLCSELSAFGIYGIEFKRDPRDGNYKLIDFNGRNPLCIVLPIGCGIDIPWMMYSDLIMRKRLQVPSYHNGIYFIDEWADLTCFIKYRKYENFTLREYIAPYLSKKVFAVSSLDDPLPTIAMAIFIVRAMPIIRNIIKSG